ncbi:hypothetical protein [Tenacibaculum amylolyticum]|uniref:hypothetical protein n=1 Tax=Tenacibaculum amylolyticum TaxID=104269 RepID=UPI003893E2EB
MKEIFLKNTIKLIIGGIAIGLLHQYDLLIAILLGLKIIHSFYKRVKTNSLSILFIIGFILTGIIGFTCEYLGTSYGYWEYHDVPYQTPRWLFFAWGAAFILIYQIEAILYQKFPNMSNRNKNLYILFIVAFFPTLGEMVAINLGTWTYYVPYKIFGVPLGAIAALIIIHATINVFLGTVGKQFGIKDIVYNPIT